MRHPVQLITHPRENISDKMHCTHFAYLELSQNDEEATHPH